MFRFRSRVLHHLDNQELELIGLRIQVDKANRYLRTVMSNQELFDSYAAKIADQNSQIKAAVAVVISEIGKLQAAAKAVVETPLDTSKMDAAISQLTAAVDEVEAIPAPVADEPPAPVEPVEVDPSDLADEEDEESPEEE